MNDVPSVVVPIITPFNKREEIYEKGAENLISFLNNKGIRGIWILGSYGSFPLLSLEERKDITEIYLSLAGKYGMYSIVQIGAPDLATALKLADHARQAGADALASVLPFYYSSASYREDNFIYYFKSLLKSTDLPVFYYNNPKTTGYNPDTAFIKKLLQAGVSGMKDTTTNFLSISQNLQAFRELRPEGIYMGGSASVFLPARFMGAPSVVCGTAVSMPELVLELDKNVASLDWYKSQNIQHMLIKAREVQSKYVSRPMACYGILSERGVDVGQCRAPWRGMSRAQRKDVVNELYSLKAIPSE